MQEIINLDPSDYYTQRNNRISPEAACMPTARAMFYCGNGIAFDNPSDMQDDDYFMSVLQRDESLKLAKQKYPALIAAGYPPYMIHGMYHSYLDLQVVGRRTSDFVTDLTFDDYVDRIRAGQVIMTSGSFPGIEGHAFCVMGLEAKPCNGIKLVIADPWGDFHTDYKSQRGYAVLMTRAEFKEHVKPGQKHKWGHIII